MPARTSAASWPRSRPRRRARIEALEQALATERGRTESDTKLRAELDELRERVTELGENTLKGKRLRRELDETRALVEGLGARIEQVQVEAVGDEEARRLLNDLRDELAEMRSGAAQGAGESEQLLAAAREAREAAAAVRETQAAVERLAQNAEDAVEVARGHSSEAFDAAAPWPTGWRAPSRRSTPSTPRPSAPSGSRARRRERRRSPARRSRRSTHAPPR